MDMRVSAGRGFGGGITAVSSKSDAHRLFICAALADAPTRIYFSGQSEDILATLACVGALGARVERVAGGVAITPAPACKEPSRGPGDDCPGFYCNESGSTLRFMIPVAAALLDRAEFFGSGRLRERPLEPLLREMRGHGCSFEYPPEPSGPDESSKGAPILRLRGRLTGGRFTVPGDVSSQFVSGLLMALPLIGGGSVAVTGPVQSKSYIDITASAMKRFGVDTVCGGGAYAVESGRPYRSPGELSAEGDWSNAAFWLAANYLGADARVTGLNADSPQGDKAVAGILEYLRDGAPEHLVDAAQIPDLVPVLAVAAAVTPGVTRIYNAERVRLKESDRLSAMARNLSALGAQIKELPGGLVITGVERLSGGEADGWNDHRVVMACAVASLVCDRPVIIRGAQAVNKSYPQFFEDFKALGGEADVI